MFSFPFNEYFSEERNKVRASYYNALTSYYNIAQKLTCRI